MRTTWIPLIFLLSGWALVLAIWVVLDQSESGSVHRETVSTSERVYKHLESCVQTRMALIDALSNQEWQDQRDIIANWSAVSRPLLDIFSGVQAVNYVDNEGIIRVVSPVSGNEPALGKNLFNHPDPEVPKTLAAAKASGKTVRTNTVTLLQSGRGFTAYKQLFTVDGEPLGYVNSVFRINALIQDCMHLENIDSQYRYQLIEESGQVIYSRVNRPQMGAWDFEVNQAVQILDKPWQLRLAPTTDYVASLNSILDEVLSLVGGILTLLLAWAIRTLLVRQNFLQESETRYRQLIENQSDLIVHYSANLEIIYASPNYCELHGKSLQELLGTQFRPEIHEEDQHTFNESQTRLRTPPYVSQYDRMRVKIDGDWRWFAWSYSGVVDENGHLETVTAIGRDITELMRLEIQVSQAQKMQAVGQMAGGISHDFNNLLQVMLANIEFVLEDLPSDSPVIEDLMRVKSSINRAMELSQRLASLNRQQPQGMEIIDLEPLMGQFVELLLRTLGSTIEIHYQPTGTEFKIRGNASEIEQVILNLCFNARDSIEGNGSIRLSLNRINADVLFRQRYPELTEDAYVCIRIKDDGCGMEPETLARIFDPFYSTKAAGSGTGLGLTNCYGIVQQHDGLILADSKPGKGSTFRIYLPLTDEAITDSSIVENIEVGMKKHRDKILVVDDDPEVLELTLRTLDAAGYNTVSAANGALALEMLRQVDSDISLVVMDLVMPVMDGRSAGAIIRAEFPDIKILYVSGFDPDSGSPQVAPLNGPLLRKPYRAGELYEAIKALVDS